jgi:hypothetical protein
MKVIEYSTLDNPESWHCDDDTVIEFKSAGDACLAAELFSELQEELSDIKTRKTMLVGQCAELATSLRASEAQLVVCAQAYRAADNFDEAQRCKDIAFMSRLVLKKWEEL